MTMTKNDPKPKKLPALPEGSYYIVGAKTRDSCGTEDWKEYLDGGSLREAWSPPSGSPYEGFFKTRAINSVDGVGSEISPRYSEGEITSQSGIDRLVEAGVLDANTAVVLDSGGAHSVAMAVNLMKQGYQPVVMFDAEPRKKRSNGLEEGLATLLYFAKEVEGLKRSGVIRADSPPVFIMDCHRDDPASGDMVDSSYSYERPDLPTGDALNEIGINKVVYLNEGDQGGEIWEDCQSTDALSEDLKQIVQDWEQSDISMLYTGVRPWPDHGWESRRPDGLLDSSFLNPDFDSDDLKRLLANRTISLKKR